MNGRRDGAAAGSARGSDQAPLASSIPPPAQAPTQSRYAARLSWLSSLEKDSDSLSQRVDRMAKDHTILTKTKATNAVFDSAPAVVASPTGQTGPASDFFSRRASFNGPRSSVDSASSEQGSKRWSTLSTASAPIETTGRISMDRQGSSGLASLVSTLESAKDKRSSVKVAPPPTPDKHWPKVRELVKTMEKKKPDPVQSPSTTSPGASPQRKNSLKSLLTPTRSMTTSPSSTPSPKPAAKPARPASMYILPPVSQSSSFAVSLATTASNPATTATLSRSTSSYGRRTPSQSPSRPWLATTTPPSSSFIAAAASLPTPPAVERTPSVAEISKRLKEIQPSTSFTAAAASLPTPPAIERTPSVAEISKRLEETMKAAVCASPVSTAPPLPVLPATGNVSRRISSLSPTGRAKSTEGGRTASNARMRNSVVIEKAVVVEDVNVPATVVDAFEALKAWEEKSPASVVDAFTTEANKEKSPASVETAVKAVEIAVDVIPASGGDSGSKLVFKPRTSSLRMDPGVAALPLVKPQETSIVEKVPRRTQSTMEINQDEPRGRTLSVRPQKSVPDMKDVVTPTETSFSKSMFTTPSFLRAKRRYSANDLDNKGPPPTINPLPPPAEEDPLASENSDEAELISLHDLESLSYDIEEEEAVFAGDEEHVVTLAQLEAIGRVTPAPLLEDEESDTTEEVTSDEHVSERELPPEGEGAATLSPLFLEAAHDSYSDPVSERELPPEDAEDLDDDITSAGGDPHGIFSDDEPVVTFEALEALRAEEVARDEDIYDGESEGSEPSVVAAAASVVGEVLAADVAVPGVESPRAGFVDEVVVPLSVMDAKADDISLEVVAALSGAAFIEQAAEVEVVIPMSAESWRKAEADVEVAVAVPVSVCANVESYADTEVRGALVVNEGVESGLAEVVVAVPLAVAEAQAEMVAVTEVSVPVDYIQASESVSVVEVSVPASPAQAKVPQHADVEVSAALSVAAVRAVDAALDIAIPLQVSSASVWEETSSTIHASMAFMNAPSMTEAAVEVHVPLAAEWEYTTGIVEVIDPIAANGSMKASACFVPFLVATQLEVRRRFLTPEPGPDVDLTMRDLDELAETLSPSLTASSISTPMHVAVALLRAKRLASDDLVMGDLDDFEVSDTPSVGSPLLGLGMQAEAHEAGDGEVCAISEETEVVQTVARVEEGQMDKCAVPLRSLPADSELQVQGFSLREVEETRLPAKKEETPSDERHLSSDASSSDVEITQSSVVNSPTNPVIQLVSATVTPPRLCLHLHVENRHFSKHLSALYTADRWATTKTSALGTFVGPVEGKDGWDVFEVTLDLDGPCRIDAAFKLEMGGTDYWDSRGGLNHFFVVERRKNVQPKETDAVADCVEGLIHETVLRELITRTSPSMTPSSLFRPASSVSLNSSPTSDEDRFDDFDGWKRPDSAIWLPSYRNSLSSIMSREEVGAKRDLTVDPVIKEEDEDGASVVVIVAEKEAGADDDFVEIKSRVDDGGAAVVSRNAVAMAKLQAEDTAIDKDGENAAMDVVIAEVEDKEQAKEVLVIDIQELTADAGTADIIAEADVDLSAKEARVESDDRAMCTEVTPVEAELETANVVAPAEVETHAEDSLVEVKESLANDAVMSKSEHSPDALTCVIATAESAEDITQVWIDDITVATDLYERSGNVTVVVEGETEEVTLISVEGEAVHGRDFEIIAKEARDVRVQGIEVIVKVEPEIDIDTNNAENRLKGLAIAAVAREEAQDGTVIQRLHEAVEDACLAAEVEELSDDSPETDDKKISVATKTEGLNRGIADTASNYDQIVPYGELDSVPGVVTQEQLEGSIVVAYTIVEEPAIVAKPEVQPVIITAADGANDAEEAVANVSEAGEPASISEIVVATADKDVVSEEGLEAVGVADDVNAGAKNEDPVANQTAREHVVELDVQPEDVELEEFTINAAVDGARQVEDVTTTGSSEEQSVPTEVKEVPEHATFGQEVGERQEVVSVTVNLKRAEGEAADEEQNVAVVVGQQAEDIAGVTVVTESLEAIVTVELQTDVSIASDEQVEDRADEIDERVDSAVTLDDRKASEVVANDCQTESVVERIQELADIGNDDPADDETTIASAKDEYVLTNIAAVWADAGHLVEGGSSERAIDVTLEGAAKAQGLSIVDVDKKVHVVEAAVAEARKVAVQLESDVVAQEKARAVVSEEEEVVGREVSAAKLGVEKGVDDVKAETDGAGVAVNTVQEVLMEGGVDIDGTGRQAVDVEMRDLAISEASSMATEDPGERVVVDGKSDAQKAEATAEEPVIAVLSIEPLLDDLGAPSVDDEALVMPEIGKTPEAADETKEKQVIQREHISFDSVDLIDRHVDVDVDAAEAVKAGTINLHEVDFANRDMDVSVAELPMEVDVATKKMAPALDYKPAEWSDVEEVARLHSAISSISWTKAADDQLEGGVHSVFAEVASLRNVSLIAFIAHFAMVSIAYIVPKIGSAIAVLFEPVRIGHALVACIVVLMVVGTGRRAVEGK